MLFLVSSVVIVHLPSLLTLNSHIPKLLFQHVECLLSLHLKISKPHSFKELFKVIQSRYSLTLNSQTSTFLFPSHRASFNAEYPHLSFEKKSLILLIIIEPRRTSFKAHLIRSKAVSEVDLFLSLFLQDLIITLSLGFHFIVLR